MRAIVYDAYGPLEALRLAETEAPPPPAAGEVRVRVLRAALNPKDALVRKGKFRLLSGGRFPKLCGLDLAGTVMESRAEGFAPGDRVLGMLAQFAYARGTLAEEVNCRAHELARLPERVSFEAGAAVALAGSTALQALRDLARVGPGARVLVNGAAGGVGTFGVQVARCLGAAEVHATASPKNHELCRRLGASTVWDYASDDLSRAAPPFDAVLDAFGNRSRAFFARHLGARGVYVGTIPSARLVAMDVLSRLSLARERLVVVAALSADLACLAGWLAEGRMEAVVEARFPLEKTQDAFRLLETRRARGKIVIEVG